jgi:SHS2 domain-containing protein
MPYKFLEDMSIADVAFEAQGKTLEELFEGSALAVTNTMVEDVRSIEQKTSKNIEVGAENVEMLLFHFLQELIFYKDAELLLFSKFDLAIEQMNSTWHLRGKAYGEEISPDKHELLADVKAVSLYKFRVEKATGGWQATVIIDV